MRNVKRPSSTGNWLLLLFVGLVWGWKLKKFVRSIMGDLIGFLAEASPVKSRTSCSKDSTQLFLRPSDELISDWFNITKRLFYILNWTYPGFMSYFLVREAIKKHDILWHRVNFICSLPTLPNYDIVVMF